MITAAKCNSPSVLRFRLRTLFVGVAILSIVFAYGAAYYRVSRRGIAEAKHYGLTGFLYLPADEVFASEDLTEHQRMALIFGLANWIDQHVFGGPPPVRCMMFRLT